MLRGRGMPENFKAIIVIAGVMAVLFALTLLPTC